MPSNASSLTTRTARSRANQAAASFQRPGSWQGWAAVGWMVAGTDLCVRTANKSTTPRAAAASALIRIGGQSATSEARRDQDRQSATATRPASPTVTATEPASRQGQTTFGSRIMGDLGRQLALR
jgi:hypothetical protein